ncbi:MAG: hypothetical protein EOP86_09550 [Verrucomicrobiaceae bacterium]|uniref:Uncharacterized protein n=1 Tax=Corallococcus soli TaxID=2710757 RepID=A0ABR9PG20_9BACT|nr:MULTISPECIES: hypothetical protein [Corallococcus]MBE4746862.1 hypothetical protein [Corallococcus soli]MCY1030413.1 hypothetical protein [Corallococcus sp. BB11-1]RYD35019.1 MAG: hypothetical protein EOP86_09550 [Verrucomicrobiaceae bacterium]
MLKTAWNEWSLKALQLETALLALEEIELPDAMHALHDAAQQKVLELARAWQKTQPAKESRQWKREETAGGTPRDEELADLVKGFREDAKTWTLLRMTSDRKEVVETLVSEGRACMAAGGEYYLGQWDAEAQVLEVGRDDETGETGTGLVLEPSGELHYTPSPEL